MHAKISAVIDSSRFTAILQNPAKPNNTRLISKKLLLHGCFMHEGKRIVYFTCEVAAANNSEFWTEDVQWESVLPAFV